MFFGGPRRKNTLANQVRRAEARARKIQRKAELKARLKKAQGIIKRGTK
jgi:hypothetical protein